MSVRWIAAIVIGAVLSHHLVAADPVREAVAAGRRLLNGGRYEAAIQQFQAAIPGAAAIQDAEEKAQALAAIHFFSAVAFHRLGNESKTREEIAQFLLFTPGEASLDAKQWDAAFVQIFNEEVETARRSASREFDRLYPGFAGYQTTSPNDSPLEGWGASTAMILLGTDEERSNWNLLRDDRSRHDFIEEFWEGRSADFRRNFEARVRFADRMFAMPSEERGSLSDRGRTFVLLGKPQFIQVKTLSRRDAGLSSREPNLGYDGTVERWFYTRDQLPWAPPARQIEFRFITRKGVGDHVLQRDQIALKVLDEAAKRGMK